MKNKKVVKINKTTEMRKLEKLVKAIPADRLPIAQSLYKELVFMQNTLQDLKEQVEKDGAVSYMEQGSQKLLIQHPALKGYNTTVQRYNLLFKQLIDLLPPAENKPVEDPLLDFIRKAD